MQFRPTGNPTTPASTTGQQGQPSQQPGQPAAITASAAAAALGSAPNAGTLGGVQPGGPSIGMTPLGQNNPTQGQHVLPPPVTATTGNSRLPMPDLRGLAEFGRGLPGVASSVSSAVASTAVSATALAGKLIKNTASPVLKPIADKVTLTGDKNPRLSKQTTSYASGLYGKTISTIQEPMTKAEKSAEVATSLLKPATAKMTAAAQGNLNPATATRVAPVTLATVNCNAFADRLRRSVAVLQAVGGRQPRDVLHDLTNSTLQPTAFSATARFVRLASKVGPLNTGYVDRQTDTLASSREAHIEQGIKTLNLLSESRHFEASFNLNPVPAGGEPAHRAALRSAMATLNNSHTAADTALNTFHQDYTNFVANDLGLGAARTVAYAQQINELTLRGTAPARRNQLHAEVMAQAVAERRIGVALDAVNPADRVAIAARLATVQRDNTNPMHADRPITQFVDEITGRTGIGASAGAGQFLNAFAAMKGPPLDEVLRVRTGAFRDPWTPATPAPAGDRLSQWRENQTKDMEKINTELTSIALHVRAAARTGTLAAKLDEVFPPQDGVRPQQSVAIENQFEQSYRAVRDRTLGQPLSAQDKLNIKLAKCVLDNGSGVRFLAKELKNVQENYVTRLAASPDMLKVLKGGSTGASYDPVEQRANARTRVDNLRMAMLDADPGAQGNQAPAATDYSQAALAQDVATAKALIARPALAADKKDALRQHLFLMENYVRQTNSDNPAQLLRQLSDNDARCGTDALVTENMTVFGNGALALGGKVKGPFSLNGSVDGSLSAEFPSDRNPFVRNEVPSSLVLTESSAYSMKAITDLKTTVFRGTLKGALAAGLSNEGDVQSGFSLVGNGNVGYERVTIENERPGLACMVHKAPVLDGTRANGKVSGAMHVALNDAVSRALFATPAVPNVVPLQGTGVEGWENLSQFLAATERTTLEPLTQRKEVTTTLSFGEGASPGVPLSGSVPDSGKHRATLGARLISVSTDQKLSHSYREETLVTPTVEKLTSSDTFSDTRSGSAGASLRWGGALSIDLGAAEAASVAAHAGLTTTRAALGENHPLTRSAEEGVANLDEAKQGIPKFRYTTTFDGAKVGRGIEQNREYRELYKRVVRDQFGNEIPSMVRDSKTSTDGRVLVNNLVNDIGLVNATVSQRIDEGGGAAAMSSLEKETLTKLLCLSTIASHYRNAGSLGTGAQVPNDNLTVNVTAALNPAAAARHGALKTGLGTAAEQDAVLGNSLNYGTIGAAGGFKNQDTSAKVNMLMSRSKRSTSSAQSMGYPSGTELFDRTTARQFDELINTPAHRDIKAALSQVGMGEPLSLWDQYAAIK